MFLFPQVLLHYAEIYYIMLRFSSYLAYSHMLIIKREATRNEDFLICRNWLMLKDLRTAIGASTTVPIHYNKTLLLQKLTIPNHNPQFREVRQA